MPGAILALVIFLAGSTGLREYITFIVAHNHAYGALAAPIAALLFFYLLALGVLLGAELNAEIEQRSPSPVARAGGRAGRRLASQPSTAGSASRISYRRRPAATRRSPCSGRTPASRAWPPG